MTTEQNIDSPTVDLKAARENLGLTLKDIFERTRISVANLEAIEKGNFYLLPVPIYARNFIKTYADILGVDAEPVLQSYESYINSLQLKEKADAAQQTQQSFMMQTLSRNKTYLWIACIIIVFAGIYVLATHSRKAAVDIPPAAKEEPLAQTPAPKTANPGALDLLTPENLIKPKSVIQEPAQESQAVATNVQEEVLKPSVILISAIEQTWIRIQYDDKEAYEVLLQPGQKMTKQATRFKIDIGNAGGVRLQVDGKDMENLGKSGQVVHLNLP